jgi:hypothetical protein
MVATVLAMLVLVPEAWNRLAAVIAMFAGIPTAIATIRDLLAAVAAASALRALAAGALSAGTVAAVDERIVANGCYGHRLSSN